MKIDQAKTQLIDPNLKQGEELIGFFQGQYTPSFWWFWLIGPFLFLGVRVYFVAVTDQGMQFHKLSFWGKPNTYNFFPWNEIEKLKLGKGILSAPLKLKSSNGKKLRLKAQLKGLAKLDEKTKEMLLSKMS